MFQLMFQLKFFVLIFINSLILSESKEVLNVKLLTFNVNVKEPMANINELLNLEAEVDVYSIGLQEVNPLIDMSHNNEKAWVDTLTKFFTDAKYTQIGFSSIQTSIQLLFIRQDLKDLVLNVRTSSVKTGVKQLTGNKGGTAISFEFDGRWFCFVNSHLAARAERLPERIDNFKIIYEKLNFDRPKVKKVNEHDLVFWSGDLNFRLERIELQDVLSMIDFSSPVAVKASSFMKFDQLTKVINEKKAFTDFKEGEIKFLPTYKYHINEDKYDPAQKPAYTDRILYKLNDKSLHVTNAYYLRVDKFKLSDHRPVVAMYAVKF